MTMRLNNMEITETRTYRFTAAELDAIKIFCQLADSIAISENMDYGNNDYYAEDFFFTKNIKNMLITVYVILLLV